jgi:hypothetical protein
VGCGLELDTETAIERATTWLRGYAPEAVSGEQSHMTYKIACTVADMGIDNKNGKNGQAAFRVLVKELGLQEITAATLTPTGGHLLIARWQQPSVFCSSPRPLNH